MKIHATLALLIVTLLTTATSLRAQAIVGAWRTSVTNTEGTAVLVFFSNGYYVLISDALASEGPSGYDGYERGTYTWSGTNNTAFTATPIADADGDVGLSSINNSTSKLSISGNALSIIDPDGIGTTPVNLTRVVGTRAIVGAWFAGDVTSTLSTSVVVFTAANTYFLASDQATEAGMERGTYTWNSSTGAFSSTTIVNTDGTRGLSNPPFITNVTISGSQITLTDSAGPTVLNSVSAIPEPSTYAAIAGLGALGLAVWRRRRNATA
jgi:PEP-CTERM motif